MDASAILVQLQPGIGLDHLFGGRDVQFTPTHVPGLVRVSGEAGALAQLAQSYVGAAGVSFVEWEQRIQIELAPNDPGFSGGLWGLNGAFGINAPAAWDTTTGSSKVSVAVVDTGIDYLHPDLYLNIWINQDEIPTAVKTAIKGTSGWDVDGDGLITFWDLNNGKNQGAGKVMDVDGDGRITGADILSSTAQGGWADGVDGDGNNYVDDLIGWDWVNNDNDPMDDHSHGTHIAGTIGAIGNNGLGVTGINWKVQLVGLKVLNSSGSGNTGSAGEAIWYAADEGIQVSNNSYGGTGGGITLSGAISYGANKNHIFVAAAGNYSTNIDVSPFYPASFSYGNLISVASTGGSGWKSGFSNYGAVSVDVGAPGESIYSTMPGGGYGYKSGTSMATPHVAGAVALIYAANPTWSYSQVTNQLYQTVTPISGLNGLVATGGIINLGAALAAVGPQIQVSQNGAVLADGGGVDFGLTPKLAPVTMTFTIKNVGTETVSISSVSVPSGYSLVSGPAGSLAVGATTTFQVRLNATTSGTYSGQIQVFSNDPDGSFDISVTGKVASLAPTLVQPPDQSMPTTQDTLTVVLSASDPDGDPLTYTAVVVSEAYQLDQQYGFHSNGDLLFNWGGQNEKWWQGSGSSWYFILPTGQLYEWDGSNAASGALIATLDAFYYADPTRLFDATPGAVATLSGNVLTVNPEAGFIGKLFVTASASDGILASTKTFTVNVTAASASAPEIQVLDGSTDIADGTGSVSFGSTVVGTGVTKTFTVKNTGNAALTLGSISLPAGFTLASGFGASTLAAGQQTTFAVSLTAGAAGTFSGQISFTNNDGNESPFNFAISGTVSSAPAPEIQVLDGSTDIADGTGSVSFGSTVVGTGLTKTFTVKNTGNAALTLGSISLPAGFTLASGFGSTTLAAGQQTTFAVSLTASVSGSFSGQISFTNNDGNEGPFNFSISGTVTAPANQAPVLTQPTDKTMPTTQDTLTVPLVATDPNGDPLTYSVTVQTEAQKLDQQYGFFSDGKDHFNWGGKQEKWWQGSGGKWFFILQTGQLYQWDGSGQATGTLIATLDAAYYADPSLLYNAPSAASANATLNGNTVTINPNAGFVGKLFVTATASDGSLSDSKTFTVTVTPASSANAPVLTQPADKTMPTSQNTTSVTLTASDPNGDPITYSATVQSEAYQLDQQYGFYSDGNQWTNWGGKQEKWFLGAGGKWHFILSTGQVYAWDGSSQATGTLLFTIESAYYADPSKLFNATVGATVSVSGNTLTIDPAAGFVGKLIVTATASDGSLSDSKTFKVTVTP